MRSQHLNFSISWVWVTCALAIMLVHGAFAANKEKVLYSFSGGSDGGDPATALIFDRSGNAYGTSVVGGANGFGTVFQLKRASGGKWIEIVLYSFGGSPDGMYPYGGVIFDKSGNLYGTTVGGGSGTSCGSGCGTVFKLSKSGSNWSETVLYSFLGGNDGFGPGGALIFDKKGNLYGTTPDGGAYSNGTIYTLIVGKNGQWTERVIHSFAGGNEGATGSLGQLLLDKAGNLYGVTETQGPYNYGTVYKLSPNSGNWTLTTLYGFKGEPDAGSPYGGLIADAKGNLYGTTYYAGANGLGALFTLTKGSNGSWRESVLYSFQGGKDGSATTTTLLFDKTRNLYGTTSMGGDLVCDCGTVFKLTRSSGGKWKESIAHRFTGNPDGAFAYYGLALDKAGTLYSTTVQGGSQGQGTVFEVKP